MHVIKTRHTDTTGVGYFRRPGGWQHVDTNDGFQRPVGDTYATKAELLADHEAYLVRAGWAQDHAT